MFEGENLPSTSVVEPATADEPYVPYPSNDNPVTTNFEEEQPSHIHSHSPNLSNAEHSQPAESHQSDQTLQNLPVPSPPYSNSEGNVMQPENQGESSTESDFEETPPDRIMTGWDPIRPIAGQKRAHSPEKEYSPVREYSLERKDLPSNVITLTKRGRAVRKHD